MGRTFALERTISKSTRPHGAQSDPRFILHQRQPRADKLDARQRRLCIADPAFKAALRGRVRSPERFSAFMDGATYYIALERPCAKCGNFKKRTRDRSCYQCHLNRGGENFERMKAGLAPKVARNNDSHLDLIERKRAERDGEFLERRFGDLVARRWPLGRLEITFPDGWHEADLIKLRNHELINAIREFAALKDALEWAGWTVPYIPDVG
jgi:hypothetical protein